MQVTCQQTQKANVFIDFIGASKAAMSGGRGMGSTRWDKRLWDSTRGRIILLLRRGSRTVNDLAAALRVTDNAVRTHLDRLERDGLIYPSGTRPGTRKPNITYSLTPEAERLFPKMYGPILRQFLEVLAERLSAKKLDEIVRLIGHRMAAAHRSAVEADKLEDRVAEAIALLGEGGGACESERHDGKLVVRCFDCPLAVAVIGHPELCRLVETMLADLLGVPVQQRCEPEPTPQCYFEIASADGQASPRPAH
jgi:predicted ArsR family transcriptional regulator